MTEHVLLAPGQPAPKAPAAPSEAPATTTAEHAAVTTAEHRPASPAVTTRSDEPTGRWGAARARLAQLARKPVFLLAVLYVLFVVVSAFAPGLFTSYGPYDTHPEAVVQAPSIHHLFGTDTYGRDLFSRVLHGSALTIKATLIALGIAVVAGLALGVVSGFVGGLVDAVLMRLVDVLLAIPSLLLALSIVTALGYGTVPVAIAVGVSIIPGFARTTRAEVLRVKTLPYVEAARAGGASWGRVLLRHILPNSWGPVAVLTVLDGGIAIIAIASLSFLGFGAKPPAAEWGTLIATGRNYLLTASWISLLPGLFVALLVLSLNHISKTMQELER
ncbi:ABC transporter permease [Pseudofrankia inefficax]|uniref:Binding-protein-dependent transport systems inner membrane component n=1 Tax=Pseudofrankia inefficax (strain DSM 45817 / CECT 9037 / DDB 130130 / EuI1c) TaxID=298654 RepID=E3IV50_PSEI1|nr:ABC transporter permease [Pseudofrankia inefficax]ADP80070.1 binding-protein-dependent transport systems inner membrane component [Pseudofrankia inefficax]